LFIFCFVIQPYILQHPVLDGVISLSAIYRIVSDWPVLNVTSGLTLF